MEYNKVVSGDKYEWNKWMFLSKSLEQYACMNVHINKKVTTEFWGIQQIYFILYIIKAVFAVVIWNSGVKH